MIGQPPAETRRKTGGIRLSERAWGYLLASPAFVLVGLVAVAPIAAALWLSLHRRLPVFGVEEFVGLWNYVQLWSDDRFWAACRTAAGLWTGALAGWLDERHGWVAALGAGDDRRAMGDPDGRVGADLGL